MKEFIKKLIRAYCPDIKPLRDKLTAIKLREIRKYTVEASDLINGDASLDVKRKLVEKYSGKWPAYTRVINEAFEDYIKRSGTISARQDIDDLRVKALYDCYCYGFYPDEFFVYQLENRSLKEKRSYISNMDKELYSYMVNDIVDMDIFFDKYHTYKRFKQYYNREAIAVEKPRDYAGFKAFVKSHPVFVRKNVLLSKGDSVELVDRRSCGKTVRQLFDDMIANGKYIVEERVEQSSYMSSLNPSSVNTIRCMTFGSGSGIKIGPCFLKVGQGNSFVDNGGKGGILIGIDNKTGILNTIGYDEFLREYHNHPDTGAAFVGYQLPEWDRLIAMVKEMSSKVPSVRYIGWDLAHTDSGWVVIEGNASGQFIGPQIVWQRGIKKDIEVLLGHRKKKVM